MKNITPEENLMEKRSCKEYINTIDKKRPCTFGYMLKRGAKMPTTKQFVVNEKGEKTAVILDIKTYGELLEDRDDLKVFDDRKDEPTISFDDFDRKMRRKHAKVSSNIKKERRKRTAKATAK